MSEEQEQEVDSTAGSASERPSGGERLRAARRDQQISVHEVAKELHLDEAKVRALEANDFEVLGAAVFAKGHLRKYAELVGVDPDDVFADYYKMTHTADLPPVVSGRPKIRRELSPGPWIAVGILLIALVVAYWWFVVRSSAPAVEPAPAAPSPAETAAAVSPRDDSPSASVAADEPIEAPVEMAPIEAEPAPADDGLTRISLDFSGDCWTEISDANGQRLFFEMGRAGRSVEFSGTAPFNVLFGNVENVSVRVDGNDYAVSPANPGSRTARLTILEP